MSDISNSGSLSPIEAQKSARDAILLSVGPLVIQLLEILKATNFGENTIYVSLAVAIATPLINRVFNIWRI